MKTNNKRIKKLNNISALIIAKNAEDNIKKCFHTDTKWGQSLWGLSP